MGGVLEAILQNLQEVRDVADVLLLWVLFYKGYLLFWLFVALFFVGKKKLKKKFV